MPPAFSLSRLRRLGPGELVLAGEALALLAAASLAIRLLPFRTVAATASRGEARRTEVETGERIARIVAAVARRVPWRTVCFQKGLACHWMLRRRGVASLLHYGVGRAEEERLSGHVWVSVGGRTVIGGEEAPRFSCLATFPPANPLKG